ncbi:hypothetical protein EJ06DRAFT_39932 [Trichodelitschia bisporula]|uniref:Uncharacterized protein n=1 Tax=Trichodelitschia bisporula TaxID=703511 RepID=A0A6G1HVH7_9PEZI|nr:hypothetical protein EJ06DRAFT_39932 [Trichodelitschia bisporula]
MRKKGKKPTGRAAPPQDGGWEARRWLWRILTSPGDKVRVSALANARTQGLQPYHRRQCILERSRGFRSRLRSSHAPTFETGPVPAAHDSTGQSFLGWWRKVCSRCSISVGQRSVSKSKQRQSAPESNQLPSSSEIQTIRCTPSFSLSITRGQRRQISSASSGRRCHGHLHILVPQPQNNKDSDMLYWRYGGGGGGVEAGPTSGPQKERTLGAWKAMRLDETGANNSGAQQF